MTREEYAEVIKSENLETLLNSLVFAGKCEYQFSQRTCDQERLDDAIMCEEVIKAEIRSRVNKAILLAKTILKGE